MWVQIIIQGLVFCIAFVGELDKKAPCFLAASRALLDMHAGSVAIAASSMRTVPLPAATRLAPVLQLLLPLLLPLLYTALNPPAIAPSPLLPLIVMRTPHSG
jgi:hypothetical protein